jgi:uncharacterized protein (TIGR01777 family)
VLVRRAPAAAGEVFWDPAEQRIDPAAVEDFDAVVHLAGESIDGWWSEAKRHRILESRRRGTALLARALAVARRKPRVLVAASGVGYYGLAAGSAAAPVDERAPLGGGFLAQVAAEWEAAAEPARAAGIRVVHLRLGVVLARAGGVLARLYWPFFAGLGGPVGGGGQLVSWVARDDAVRAIEAAIARQELAGALNVCAPQPCTNAHFMAALGAAMHRPALLPLPALAVSALFGQMGEETLLASTRALPAKLLAAGFNFEFPGVESAMAEAVK